jgi:PAN domain-containing protein
MTGNQLERGFGNRGHVMGYSTRFQALWGVVGLVLWCHPCYGSESAAMSDPDYGFDRAGGDYRHLDLKTSDPTLCEDACASDSRCVAWSYVRPHTVKGPRPTCWLKNSVPEKREVAHCVSGTKSPGGEAHR